MLFGDRLKSLRLAGSMTQAELSKKIGVSYKVLAYYESNERFPRKQETLVKLAHEFNVSLDFLLGINEAPKKDSTSKCLGVTNKDSQALLMDIEKFFFSPFVKDEDRDEIFRMITRLYFDSKKKSSRG